MNRGKFASEYLEHQEQLAKENKTISSLNDREKNIAYMAFLEGMARERQLQSTKSKCNKHIVNGSAYYFKCDICGKFIAFADFENNKVITSYTPETPISQEKITHTHLHCR